MSDLMSCAIFCVNTSGSLETISGRTKLSLLETALYELRDLIESLWKKSQ